MQTSMLGIGGRVGIGTGSTNCFSCRGPIDVFVSKLISIQVPLVGRTPTHACICSSSLLDLTSSPPTQHNIEPNKDASQHCNNNGTVPIERLGIFYLASSI